MNNILFFLLPKAMCAYLYDDYTVRQALEKMEAAGYQALPILNRRGEYRGTITEGDLLWAMKNVCYMDIRQAEAHRIMEIYRRKDNGAPGHRWRRGPCLMLFSRIFLWNRWQR